MNYKYKIIINASDPLVQRLEKIFPHLEKSRNFTYVNEIFDGKIIHTWNIEELKWNPNAVKTLIKIFLPSFHRTKKWVTENHPELLI